LTPFFLAALAEAHLGLGDEARARDVAGHARLHLGLVARG
jgi:hypothetical protein